MQTRSTGTSKQPSALTCCSSLGRHGSPLRSLLSGPIWAVMLFAKRLLKPAAPGSLTFQPERRSWRTRSSFIVWCKRSPHSATCRVSHLTNKVRHGGKHSENTFSPLPHSLPRFSMTCLNDSHSPFWIWALPLNSELYFITNSRTPLLVRCSVWSAVVPQHCVYIWWKLNLVLLWRLKESPQLWIPAIAFSSKVTKSKERIQDVYWYYFIYIIQFSMLHYCYNT